jgi:hypothetical protein
MCLQAANSGLPATVRQRLGLVTGDRLDLELVGGVITLRPRRADALPERPAAEPVTTAGAPSVSAKPELPPATATIRDGATARSGKSPLPVIPPALKARGGKRKEAPVTVR